MSADSTQIPRLRTLTGSLKRNLKGISSAIRRLEHGRNPTANQVDHVTEKIIKETLPKPQAGLLVAGALEDALDECKTKVEEIAKRCHLSNRKFRDIEFDLGKDQWYCRYGLDGPSDTHIPYVAKRVTEIFQKPVFFGPNGPVACDVQQGGLNDSWFLAALSAISTVEGLVEKLCVARDEEIGVYGFVFFRGGVWKSVIIDDLLLWSNPKYDELTEEEQQLFLQEREAYHRVVEKNGKGLLYARSGTIGETWVPLMEKAYAKLHGDYSALETGAVGEGIEDLTGGVATSFQTSDLVNVDKFWHNELLHADNRMRLFGVSIQPHGKLPLKRQDVQGLWAGQHYSVLRAHECRGKRFVVLRNPWGSGEWRGAWSDGSKEWKGEWLDVLEELEHEFGDDGQFVMEYSDFLSVFQKIDRATLFDSSWVMSSLWLCIPSKPVLHPWTYGDIYYYVKLDRSSSTIIVLEQRDNRYMRGLHGKSPMWDLDFVVFKRDSNKLVTVSAVNSEIQPRSVSCEVYLEAGEYVVLPRVEPIDRGNVRVTIYGQKEAAVWSGRKMSRVLTQRAELSVLAQNFPTWQELQNIPISPDVALATDQQRTVFRQSANASSIGDAAGSVSSANETSTSNPCLGRRSSGSVSSSTSTDKHSSANSFQASSETGSPPPPPVQAPQNRMQGVDPPALPHHQNQSGSQTQLLFLCLRVYTQAAAVAHVSGRPRDDQCCWGGGRVG